MTGRKRQGGNDGKEDAKQRKIFEFLAPPSPSTSIPSPVSPSTSVPSPASPSTSVPSPASPSTSVPSPASPLTSVPSPASTPNLKLVCTFCDPPETFDTEKARRSHEHRCHSDVKGFYALPMMQDRSDTDFLFNRYAPVLPNGFTTTKNLLGIYIKNDKGEIIGAFHKVISYKGLTTSEAARIGGGQSLFSGSSYAQGHIIPGSSARDHPDMYALSFDDINFEPLHPQANSIVGGNIEDYCQTLQHDYGWNVCVFILLDKTNILGTIKATNGRTYTISANWSYLIFMERLNEHFYQAFSFPNGQPTKTYWEYRTTIDVIRSSSGIDFQFNMSESIVQYSTRIKKEKYVRENPFPCTHVGCSKRFPTAESLRVHQYVHNPQWKQKKNAANAKRREATRTIVTPASSSPDNSS